jgi:hypothetical protein
VSAIFKPGLEYDAAYHADADDDRVGDSLGNCPNTANPDQLDRDHCNDDRDADDVHLLFGHGSAAKKAENGAGP